VSSEISDLCENYDLLFFVSHFGDYFFDVCCANQNFLIRCQISTTSYTMGKSKTSEKY